MTSVEGAPQGAPAGAAAEGHRVACSGPPRAGCRQPAFGWLLASLVLVSTPHAHAQHLPALQLWDAAGGDDATAEATGDPEAPPQARTPSLDEEVLDEDTLLEAAGQRYLFVGAYYRLMWMPPVFPQLFLDEAPGLLNHGAGAELTLRKDGMSLILGLGYASYAAEGPYRASGDPPVDTEFVDSSLGLLHASASVMWSTPISDELAFEYGIGADLGLVLGSLVRSEAYREPGSDEWQACRAFLDPPTSFDGQPYCERPEAQRVDPNATTDPYDAEGAHYDVKERRWSEGGRLPNVMLMPMLPRLALRFKPHRHFVGKVEMAYNLFLLWVGVSAHYGL